MANIALRFGSDLVAEIEHNRRRSRATSRILRLSCDQRWPEDEMQDDHVIFLQALKAGLPEGNEVFGNGAIGNISSGMKTILNDMPRIFTGTR